MKICVFGAGAVGSLMASRLMQAHEAQVTIVARGAHLRAIQDHGLKLLSPEGECVQRPSAATDRPAELPPQDIVFVTLKTMAQSTCAAEIAALLKPDGHAVFANNGLPWWWKHGRADAAALPLLDPNGALWREVTPMRVLGCVIYSANELIAPGVVQHSGNNRWLLGEPLGGGSARLDRTLALMRGAGLNAEAASDIRREFWTKLLRNIATNTLCALTRLSIDGIAADPALSAMAASATDEVVRIAAALGSDIAAQAPLARESLRCGGGSAAQPLVGVRPSMLQDVLARRPVEVEAIVGQVQQFARETGTPCPVLDALLPLLRGLNGSLSRP